MGVEGVFLKRAVTFYEVGRGDLKRGRLNKDWRGGSSNMLVTNLLNKLHPPCNDIRRGNKAFPHIQCHLKIRGQIDQS